MFVLVITITCFALASHGAYIITTPKSWRKGGEVQVCIQVQDVRAPQGQIDVSINERQSVRIPANPPYLETTSSVIIPPHAILVGPGIQNFCESIVPPEIPKEPMSSLSFGPTMNITGYLDGKIINHSRILRRSLNTKKTIIQTDKYLYKPGQTVNFRVLTHTGPLMKVFTQSYSEIYITTPSRTRIFQWSNVENSNALIQLSFQLADEPEEGLYAINVMIDGDSPNFPSRVKHFKVEDYVLPRFEVTVEAPKNVLGTDSSLTFTACAKYTFGEQVKGSISWKITNAQIYDCQVIFTRNSTISGCSDVTVTGPEVRMTDCNIYRVTAEATVTEDGTGAKESGKGEAIVHRSAIVFEALRADDYIKPNLPSYLKVLAKTQDGIPAAGELIEVCHGNSCANQTVPSDGMIRAYLTSRDSKQFVIQGLVTRANMRVSKFTKTVKRYFSPSGSSLLIFAPEESLECVSGQATRYNLPVLFAAVNQRLATITVQVVSRGHVQFWKSDQYHFTHSRLPIEDEFLLEPLNPTSPNVVTGVINIPLILQATASPKIKVLVWYIRDDGEVISDAKEISVDKCLPNKVDLRWSTNKTQPGFAATWKLDTAPYSICGLGVVDKSVELLTPKKEILSVDNLFLDDNLYDVTPWWRRQADDSDYCRHQLEIDIKDRQKYYYFSHFVDALRSFDDSGIYVFSDLTLETRPCVKQEGLRSTFPPIRSGGPSAAAISSGFGGFDIGSQGLREDSTSQESTPRTDFPETWLWELLVVPSTGSLLRQQELPHTITEWVGRAVCLHPQQGIGLSPKASVITFTAFFLDLTLPTSVKRKEVLPVKISVFNYLKQTLPVTVTLMGSLEYNFVGEGPQHLSEVSKFSCLRPQQKNVHTIKIQPKSIGNVNLTVTAYIDHSKAHMCGTRTITSSVNKRDTVIKSITVEAEGFVREKSWSKYICTDEIAAGGTSLGMTELTVPPGMVEGSQRAWVTAVGDLLTISLQYLGSMIEMPFGCGEQNMLKFAPNVFILKYLEITKQVTPEAREKLLRFMRTGYQRQLLYRHNNGSYSAFGAAEDSGSTWLTAFVLKSFAQAKPFIVIDEKSFNGTRNWLLENYGSNTCATSIGKVFNKGMKGAVTGKGSVSLTAYILISVLESGAWISDKIVQKGYQCIYRDNSRDPYTLALKAYAFALTKNQNAPMVIDILMQHAIRLKNSTHWKLPREYGSRALEIETAGYVILAMMAYDPLTYGLEARKIVMWISSQRNGRGGFYTTQDTIVALQALASYESTQYQGNMNVFASVQARDFSYTFNIQESNKLVQQQVSLPTLPTTVSFSMTGEGCAVLQTVLRYNDPKAATSDVFNIRVASVTESDPFCVTKRLSACATYLLQDGASNMAIIEVHLVSGYIPEKTDLQKLLEDNKGVLKRYDVDGNKVSFYIEEFTSNREVCVNFRVVRETDVENVKPGSVVVYDYYQPEFSVSKTYLLPAISECIYF